MNLVEILTTQKFDPDRYSDTYSKELEKLIKANRKDKKQFFKKKMKSPKQLQTYLRP